MLYQHLKLETQPRVLDADKERIASVLNDFKNVQSYELIGEEILKIDEVYTRKNAQPVQGC